MIQEPVKTAKLISVMRDYDRKRTKIKKRCVDLTVSSSENGKKILIRAITEPRSKSCYVGVYAVREMIDFLETEDYDKGILIGKKFTNGAKREMKKANIEVFSENYSPEFKLERVYSTVCSYVEKLCKAKCSKIPVKDSDCKGFVKGNYSCAIRLVSDNADFHHEKKWVSFLERDLVKLFAIEKELKD